MLRGPKRQKYDPRLRAFALTLHFYSPKTYNFVREEFNNWLPSVSTISKWYQKVNGEPGFTKESFEVLEVKVQEANQKGRSVTCSLVLDEMAIRKKVEFTGTKTVGYVNMGTEISSASLSYAKEALVLTLVCINGHWKIPNILIVTCLNNLPEHVFTFTEHFLHDNFIDNHVSKLIKIILQVYFRIRLHHVFKTLDDNKKIVRSILHKTILFKNQ